MKIKKLALALLLSPCFTYANQVNLNVLTSNVNNFCDQGKDGNLKGIISFLSLNRDSEISYKGSEVTKIEIKSPQVKLQFSAAKLQDESNKYVKASGGYPLKNLYSIVYWVNFTVDSPMENLKMKMENINSAGIGNKKFGEYNPRVLEGSKTMQEFEKNLKTIQTSEYSLSLLNNYETRTPKTTVMYQCKIISYTDESLESIKSKASN